MQHDTPAVLDGVRVLDVGRYLAGPYCASLLAKFGAEVVRVEPVAGGDDRQLVPLGHGLAGALFLQANQGKRGMTLELGTEAGRAILRRLVERSDVVVANLPPAALRKLGLDYQSLRAWRQDIILTRVTAYGGSGPLAEQVGFDGVAQAMSGAAHLGGFPGAPMKAYVPFVDYGTALAAACATLAALMARARTGEGQEVDASLLRTAVCFANAPLAEEAMLASGRIGTGNRGQLYGPADIFATRDGFVLVQVIGDGAFARWARLVGEPGLAADARFANDQARGQEAALLGEVMGRWCAARTSADALRELAAARVPAGEVLSPKRCLESEQVAAAGALREVSYPGLPRVARIAAYPFEMAQGALAQGDERRPPVLGEHTDEILGELGYDRAAIGVLHQQGVV